MTDESDSTFNAALWGGNFNSCSLWETPSTEEIEVLGGENVNVLKIPIDLEEMERLAMGGYPSLIVDQLYSYSGSADTRRCVADLVDAHNALVRHLAALEQKLIIELSV